MCFVILFLCLASIHAHCCFGNFVCSRRCWLMKMLKLDVQPCNLLVFKNSFCDRLHHRRSHRHAETLTAVVNSVLPPFPLVPRSLNSQFHVRRSPTRFFHKHAHQARSSVHNQIQDQSNNHHIQTEIELPNRHYKCAVQRCCSLVFHE